MKNSNDLINIINKFKKEINYHYVNGLGKKFLQNYEKGSIRTSEAVALYSIIRNFNFKNVLDIGTGQGFSSLWFCQALLDNNKLNGSVDSIDINQNFNFDIFKKCELDKYFNFNKGSSDEVLPKLEKTYDMVLIDGYHSYEQTKKDLINVFPKVKNNGVIAFHDVYLRTYQRTGPRDVLDELEKENIGKIIYFPEEIFNMFSFDEDVRDAKRIYQKWQQHNFSYASKNANPKELMAIFVKEKENLEMKIEIQEDEDFLKEWLN